MTAPQDDRTRPARWPRLLLAGVLVGLVAAFLLSPWRDQFTLEALKRRKDDLRAQVQANPAAASLLYLGAYVAITSLSLPVATPVSLLAGALFGVLWGTALVSVASTAGATLAFLSSRYLLRDWVQRRFPRQLDAINRGVQADGKYYLLILRLTPLFPFWLVNLTMGLTAMRVWTYWWVSQLAMLPGTLLYVNAGTELGEVESLRDVASPKLLLSLALLVAVPLVVRKVLRSSPR